MLFNCKLMFRIQNRHVLFVENSRLDTGKLISHNTFVTPGVHLAQICYLWIAYFYLSVGINNVQIITDVSFTVDPGYLWKQIKNHLILVNDEAFVESEIDVNLFEKII